MMNDTAGVYLVLTPEQADTLRIVLKEFPYPLHRLESRYKSFRKLSELLRHAAPEPDCAYCEEICAELRKAPHVSEVWVHGSTVGKVYANVPSHVPSDGYRRVPVQGPSATSPSALEIARGERDALARTVQRLQTDNDRLRRLGRLSTAKDPEPLTGSSAREKPVSERLCGYCGRTGGHYPDCERTIR